MSSFNIIIPSFNTPILTELCFTSFLKYFKDSEIIVIENSDYQWKSVKNVRFINNITENVGSCANAEALTIGLKYCNANYIYCAHSDTFVLNGFYKALIEKINQGYDLIGTFRDKQRIKAYHISGLCVKSNIINKCNLYPVSSYRGCYFNYNKEQMMQDGQFKRYPSDVLDVGDSITHYSRMNNKKMYCFKNNMNNEMEDFCGRYNKIANHYSFIDFEEIHLHKSRGTVNKLLGKEGNEEEWVKTLSKLL